MESRSKRVSVGPTGVRRRELRLGVVFFGGVSLAIYENGVARALYDLVRERGIFRPITDLLDVRAQIDVIAGTSAGGINGLMLSAALESGYDFKKTARRWRNLGDLGALFRDVSEADGADSLLRGKEYYLPELERAFLDILKTGDARRQQGCPKEIDVFVTGTDMSGAIKQRRDALGSTLTTKDHRVMFHLKHRRGRKGLGIASEYAPGAAKEQAAILATLARITSSFPFAFAPFTLDEWPDRARQKSVAAALTSLGGVQEPEHKCFMDGGVLDNKPFTPALRSIFYRMPENDTAVIDRKLLFVEPDPETFQRKVSFNPLEVGAALVKLPMHDSIEQDLQSIDQHNQKIRRFRLLKRELEAKANEGAVESPLYRHARCESLVNQLWPEQDPSGERLAAVLELAQGFDYDVEYHLRRAFDLLYACGESVKEDGEHPDFVAVGRWIKALKVVLDAAPLTHIASLGPDRGVQCFKAYLSADEKWPLLVEGAAKSREALRAQFSSSGLTELLAEARAACAAAVAGQAPKASRSVLSVIEEAARRALTEGSKSRLDRFAATDSLLFPAQHSAGLRELDEIEVIRICPKDAKYPEGLSGSDKVAGDTLAHFSAFLRKDWRTNDIAWGHSDGLCQVIGTLFDDSGWELAERRLKDPAVRERFEAWLNKRLPDCFRYPDEGELSAERLRVAYKQLRKAINADKVSASQREAFTKALIEVGQEAAAQEYVELIAKDTETQNRDWAWKDGPKRELEGDESLEQLQALRIGSEETPSVVPPSVSMRYLSQAVVLGWGMIKGSLQSEGAAFRRIEQLVVTPARYVHAFTQLLRRERRFATAVALAVPVSMLSVVLTGVFTEHWGATLVGILLFFVSVIVGDVLLRRHVLGLVVVGVLGLVMGSASYALVWMKAELAQGVTRSALGVGDWLLEDEGSSEDTPSPQPQQARPTCAVMQAECSQNSGQPSEGSDAQQGSE